MNTSYANNKAIRNQIASPPGRPPEEPTMSIPLIPSRVIIPLKMTLTEKPE